MDENYKSIGEMVDRLADQYFAGGMDAYSANLRALLDTAKLLVDLPKQVIKVFSALLRDHK